MSPARPRLDKLLVDRQLAKSREHARGLVMAGRVLVGERRIDKPGTAVAEDAEIRVIGGEAPYVSRGGEKLAGALDHFALDPRGLVCVDAGISTGGFTDCLLQRGAARVYGVDVGYGQVDLSIRGDERVVLFERTNIRHFDSANLPEPVDLVVADLSFISLTIVLGVLAAIVRSGGTVLAMVKPQFEVGKGEVGKGGVVRDRAKQAAAVDKVEAFARTVGLEPLGRVPAPIQGPKGNQEYFVRLLRS